jgi:hypothetical protein
MNRRHFFALGAGVLAAPKELLAAAPPPFWLELGDKTLIVRCQHVVYENFLNTRNSEVFQAIRNCFERARRLDSGVESIRVKNVETGEELWWNLRKPGCGVWKGKP